MGLRRICSGSHGRPAPSLPPSVVCQFKTGASFRSSQLCFAANTVQIHFRKSRKNRWEKIRACKMGTKKCRVCDEAQSKYKCPTCLIPYCSLACFKKHKEIPCTKPESSPGERFAEIETVKEVDKERRLQEIDLHLDPAFHVQKPYFVDDPNEVLQESQLLSVASSSEICDMLKNEELRKLIYNINTSADAENELDKSMELEDFRILTEKILTTINP